ncbi:MAG: SPOR domain-containing protein [Kiloniellales bacterium]|nr:SPOR domain-containing protein [Kiloniellales bacterium]
MANIFGSVAAAVIASIVSVAQTSSAEDRSRTGQVKAENSPSTGNTYRVQFGAFSSEKDAEHGWKAVEASAKNLLGDLSHEVVSAGFGQEKDVVYRLRAGPLASFAASDKLCSELKNRGLECFVVKVSSSAAKPAVTAVAGAAAQTYAKLESKSMAMATAGHEPDPRTEEIRQLRAAYLEQTRLLKKLQQRLDALESGLQRSTQPAVYTVNSPPDGANSVPTSQEPKRPARREIAERDTEPEQAQKEPTPLEEQRKRIEREQVQPAVQAIEDQSGALTPAGNFVLEPRFEYVNDQRNRVLLEGFTVIPAISVGNIDIRQVDRDTLIGSTTARLGITDRFEVDVNVPFVYREQDTTARPVGTGSEEERTDNLDGNGLGDIQFAGHLQLNSGAGGWPFFIGNLSARAPTGKDPFDVDLDENTGLENELPTGSGFWGIEPSLTMLYPTDPVVLWGTAGYLWNIEESKNIKSTGENVDIDPGDALRFSVGMGVALNEKTSFGLGYQHDYVLKTKQDGTKVQNSDLQLGSLLLSGSYRVNDSTSLNLQVNAGLTDDAPDARVLLRMPMSMTLLSGGWF